MDVAMAAAASGISAAMAQLGTSAVNIANAQTPGYQVASSSGGSTWPSPAGAANNVDLASELPDQFLAALMVKVNATTMRTAVDAYESVLNATSR